MISTNSVVNQGTAQIGGFIKIEKQDRLASGPTSHWRSSTSASPTGIRKAPRARPDAERGDSPSAACATTAAAHCAVLPRAPNPHDYWPNQLYDTREGNFRDVATTGRVGHACRRRHGLRRARRGEPEEVACRHIAIGTTGDDALEQQRLHRLLLGSPRRPQRGRRDRNVETGEYGFEDFINPPNADGAPNNTLDGGTTGAENVNELSLPVNTTRETYGEDPANCVGLQRVDAAWRRRSITPTPGRGCSSRRPTPETPASPASTSGALPARAQARQRRHRQRREPAADTGLTVADGEPGVRAGQLQRRRRVVDQSARAQRAGGDHGRRGDAPVEQLEGLQFVPLSRTSATTRNATTTGYRFAVVAGKGKSFTWPPPGRRTSCSAPTAASATSCACWRTGTSAASSINYRGSIVSLYHSRQAIGTFKYGPERVRLRRQKLQVRRGLPAAGAAAAGNADVPRREHADVQADSASDPVASALRLLPATIAIFAIVAGSPA